MLFHFQLRPVNDIVPWDGVSSPTTTTPEWMRHPHLSWFGLTDGWYWIEAGPVELFRYHQPRIDAWMHDQQPTSGMSNLAMFPYVDYQVVRLWEDILDLLPAAWEPIPAQLTQTLTAGETWPAWERQVQALVDDDLVDWDLLEAAAGWWWQRSLDTAYLQAGPRIWFWSDETSIHLRWDNQACVIDDIPVWVALHGSYSVPRATFLADVRAFDAHLIGAMSDRIAQIHVAWERPDVVIDPHLDEEHRQCSQAMQRCVDALGQREPTDWGAVFAAIRHIEALPAFGSSGASRLF